MKVTLPVFYLLLGLLGGLALVESRATAHEPGECAPCPVCAPGLPEADQAAKAVRAVRTVFGPQP